MTVKSKHHAQEASFWLALVWITLVVGLALTADWLPLPAFYQMDFSRPTAPPGTVAGNVGGDSRRISVSVADVHLLGTDTMGRDIASRLVHGTRVSLLVGLVAPAIGLIVGGFLGMLAGFYRGRVETVIMGMMDTILAFPGLVLLMAVAFYMGPGLDNLLLALGFFSIPAFCRVARAKTLAIAGREFVQAARMVGATDPGILFCEILPNILSTLVVYGLFVAAYMIVAEGALSFLGLGIPPPTPSWGGMIAEAREVLEEAPHVTLIPAAAMFLTVLSFNLIGDCLRRLVDTKERQM